MAKQKVKAPKTIRFSDKLSLPINIFLQKVSLMGGNGSGKSYALTLIEEQLLELNAWVIVLDPVGIHYGLRLDASGKKSSGLNIPVFGGLHGDVPLTPESGKLIADLLCDRRLSAVLDVSQFETDADFDRFVTAFGNQFFKRMKAKKQAVVLVLEEAQDFIPQNPMEGEKHKLHAYTRIAKVGRNYGIGLVMASPRPQDIHKKIFNLTQVMMAFQMMGISERKTMDDWANYINFDIKLSQAVPTLEVGQAWVLSPRLLKFADVVEIYEKSTYDASDTPDFDTDAEAVELKPIDIEWLQERMKSLVEEAKENDPKLLKSQISKLEKEVKVLREHKPANVAAPEPQIINVPIITDDQIKALEGALASLRTDSDKLDSFLKDLDELMFSKIDDVRKATTEISTAISNAKKPSANVMRRANNVDMLPGYNQLRGASPITTAREAPLKAEPFPTSESGTLPGPQQRIIDAVAWWESIGIYKPKRSIVALLAGYSSVRSKGFSNPMGSLKTSGLVLYPDSKSVDLTDAGRALATPQDIPQSTTELHRIIFSRLPGPERRILEVLLEAKGRPVDREDLAARVGYTSVRSKGFSNPMGRLRTIGFIDYPSTTTVVALPVLFLE